MTIEINTTKCIGCGRCWVVCPSGTIFCGEGDAKPSVDPQQRCIGCAHCTDVCGVGAVEHSDFPNSRVHSINYGQCPSAEQLMLLLNARRSNRALRKDPVPVEFIDQICRAAHTAPTASNLQGIGYTVITDPAKLQLVVDYTMKGFLRLYKLLTNPILRPFTRGLRRKYQKGFQRMKMVYENGGDPILRGATALIFITAHPKSRFGAEDGNLAYQNGSLMAQTLGVSQIYTGFVLTAVRRNPGRLEKMLGIESGQITAGMALGIPQFHYTNYTERKDIRIQYL